VGCATYCESLFDKRLIDYTSEGFEMTLTNNNGSKNRDVPNDIQTDSKKFKERRENYHLR
jgi:hypothetical protein